MAAAVEILIFVTRAQTSVVRGLIFLSRSLQLHIFSCSTSPTIRVQFFRKNGKQVTHLIPAFDDFDRCGQERADIS